MVTSLLLASGCGERRPSAGGEISPARRVAGLAEARAADDAFRAASLVCRLAPLVPALSHDATRLSVELSQARDACALAARGVLARPFGTAVPEPFRSPLNTALHQCAIAFGAKASALAGLAKVADGDGAAETVSATAEWMTTAHEDVPTCLESYKAALEAMAPGAWAPVDYEAGPPASAGPVRHARGGRGGSRRR